VKNPRTNNAVRGFFWGETGIINEIKSLQLLTRFLLHVSFPGSAWECIMRGSASSHFVAEPQELRYKAEPRNELILEKQG